MIVRYYATSNRRAPFVAVFDYWPSKSGLMRTCRSGVLLASRESTAKENDALAGEKRFSAIRWSNVRAMILGEFDELGREFARVLIASCRSRWDTILKLRKQASQKQAAIDRKKAKIKRMTLPVIALPVKSEKTVPQKVLF